MQVMFITKSFGLRMNFSFSGAKSNGLGPFLRNCIDSNIILNLHKVKRFSYRSVMAALDFESPGNLHGMKALDKDAFKKSIVVLSLETDVSKINQLQKKLKKYLLKFWKMKCIEDTDKDNIKRLLFDPSLVKKPTDFDPEIQRLFKKLDLNESKFSYLKIDLGYDNFSPSTILKAVLPADEPGFSSFSIIGHVLHVNLKPSLVEYKSIIGQILYDKIPGIRTVVNKINTIDNVYRNFEMELICGEPDYMVTVRENGITYKFDFSKVYWNPRLATEHARVVDSLNMKDVLFDVFCGVGPFSLPAAKKKCTVLANDLNPESFKWLQENIKQNKIQNDYIQTYNKDGSDFICTDVKEKLIQVWKDDIFSYKIVVVMNLPALALDFLKCFKDLVKSEINDLDVEFVKKNLPIVHCYFFAPVTENPDDLKEIVTNRSGINLTDTDYSIHFVRSTAPNVNMHKFQFVLPYDYLISNANVDDKTTDSRSEEPEAKKFCKGE